LCLVRDFEGTSGGHRRTTLCQRRALGGTFPAIGAAPGNPC
jgi:hypothetical protein